MTLTEWHTQAKQIAHNKTKQEVHAETEKLVKAGLLDTEGHNLRRAAVFYAKDESEEF